jgi:hypothetical protein
MPRLCNAISRGMHSHHNTRTAIRRGTPSRHRPKGARRPPDPAPRRREIPRMRRRRAYAASVGGSVEISSSRRKQDTRDGGISPHARNAATMAGKRRRRLRMRLLEATRCMPALPDAPVAPDVLLPLRGGRSRLATWKIHPAPVVTPADTADGRLPTQGHPAHSGPRRDVTSPGWFSPDQRPSRRKSGGRGTEQRTPSPATTRRNPARSCQSSPSHRRGPQARIVHHKPAWPRCRLPDDKFPRAGKIR